MSTINQLQNEVSSSETIATTHAQSWADKLANKFWDSYLVIMGVMVLIIGLLPVTLVAMQY
ncbi:MAG: hypothetical protein HRT35_32685 [Algicola sp.]|nr:hypothetical protein [Algicola sp.]